MQPEKIGRYEIKAELGRGGMATVYRAHDPSFDREVAVKVLPREFLHDPQFLTRFNREIKTIAQLEHPAIVPVYDVGDDNGQPFFVMRNMTGGSLADWLKQGAFPLQDTARIVERLCKALAYAHKKGVVHRDLKPGNILFDSNGEAFISDFGVAKLSESASSMTGSGIIGTPAYMSPEQAQSGKVDGRSDVYAMGAIIYEMLTGTQPYRADTPMGVVIKHVTDPVPEILRDNPNLPPEVDDVIKKAMSKNREERFATAIELARALNKAAFGEEGNVTDPQFTRPITYPPATEKKKMPIAWIVGAVVLVAVVAGGLLLSRGNPLTGQADATPTALPLPTSTAVPPTETSLPLTETPVPAATAIPTPTGGASQIAFISKSEIWVMSTDGSDAYPVTNDGSPKSNLQWTPDGAGFFYISRLCAYRYELESGQKTEIACFDGTDRMDGFRLSPDGSRVAISIGLELFIVPFDEAALKTARTREGLVAMQNSCLYNQAAVKDMRWSRDGKFMTVIFRDTAAALNDAMRLFDVSRCPPADPVRRDDFPTGRFEVNGYRTSPLLPSFSWDGDTHFLFTDVVRLEGFGNLYEYDMKTQTGGKINPIEGACCYRNATFSPDGAYVLIFFQDLRLGDEIHNKLYYAPIDALTTGEFGDALPIPFDLETDASANPQFEFRPVQ